MRIVLFVFSVSLATIASAQDFPNPLPGPAHKVLAKDVGTWDCKVKMFLQGPDGPPSEYKGVETNILVSGDLYLRTSFRCDMGGRGFEGHGLTGYDPLIKLYVGVWVDNFSISPSPLKGEYDEKSLTFTVNRIVLDEAGNQLQQKQVTTWVDDSNKKFTIYLLVPEEGKITEIKLMEMNATKQK